MSTMTTKSRLFIDLDGTVARFYDASPNYLEEMYEKGYFRNLQPYENMTEGIKLFMEQHKDVEVFALSAKVNGEPPYCEAEKQEWLDEYLPEIDREHRLFTEIGHNKAEYIPNGISNTDVLYDDYNKNLIDWENSGGVALKCHNNINMKGLGAYGGDKVMWEGQVLKNDIEPQEIANSLYETVSAAQSMSSVNGEPLNEAVRTALKLINDYSVAEFGDTSAYDDVLDLSDVALAYTTDSDEEFPIQVSADLENFRIVTEYDNVVAHIDSYNSLEEMNELCFENLNFDDLIYLSEKEKQSAIDKTIIYSTEYNGEIDYFKAADKRLSVLFEKLSKDNTYAELSKAEKISAFEFAEIEQSKNLIASVTFDLDNNNVGIYHLRRAVSEGNRTPNDFISFGDSIAEMKQLVSEAKLNSLNIEKGFRTLLDKRIAERSEKNVVDIIDNYNSSGKSFHDFFEENKDKVIATYTDDIDTAYYSRHINRHWLSENFYIENRVGSDTFGSETAKSESTVLVNVYDPSKGSISNKKIDGMSWEERLNLPVETKTIGKHLLEDLKPSESPFILSAYSDLFGEEHIKKAYLKSCVEEAEKDKTMSLQIILELIWQTVNKNSKNGYRTIFVNDEVQTMLTDYTGQEATRSSKYYEETYRRIRKLGGIPTAIVQNISTFSKSTVGNAMMDNASMTILCQQGEADIEVAAARFKLTPEETKWISSGVLGTGIIKVGQKKVMYDMRIPRKVRANSLVYELCATDPSK